MSLLHRNIAFNVLGIAVTTVLVFGITPFQIRFLGIEGYAVIGFITALQAALAMFDLGLSDTVARELAADSSEDKQGSRDLIRTAHLLYWLIAAVLCAGLLLAADSIATHWLNARTLGKDVLVDAMRVIAVYLALRWPIAFYSGVLIGLQRLDILNYVKVSANALRLLGGLLVLFWYKDLRTYLYWFAFSATVETVLYLLITYRTVPGFPVAPGFSVAALRKVWRFSLTMNALAILGIVIAQMDRFVISFWLPLEALGHYNIGMTAASLITLTLGALSTAIMPHFAANSGLGDRTALGAEYLSSCRVTLFLTGFLCFTLWAYAYPLLALWVGGPAAAQSAPVLSLLAIGFWMSGLMYNMHNIAVALGRPDIYVRINLVALPLYGAALYFATTTFGIRGTACCWIVLNGFYIAATIPAVQRRLIGVRITTWLRQAVLPNTAICVCAILAPWAVLEELGWAQLTQPALVTIALSAVLYLSIYAWLFGIPEFTRTWSRGRAGVT